MKQHIIAILILLSQTLTAQQILVDKVVAKVGSEFILLSEVEEEYAYTKSTNASITANEKCKMLENIIAQKLIIYQAKLDSVEVADEEVESQLQLRFDAILRQMNGDEEFFRSYYGATINEMKERYRDDQKQKILAERMQYKLIESIEITPNEVKEFFNSIPKDSLPYFNAEVELSEIVIKPEVNSSERKKALDFITDLRNKIINKEETFEVLAKRHSKDPGSGSKGGELGYAKRGTYVPEFEAAAYSLDKDEISEPVETEFGFHIIQMQERRGNSIKLRHILITPEITVADEILAKNKLDSVRTLILSDSISFELAVKKYSNKKVPSYTNNGRLRNPASGSNFFETTELDPDTYFAIESLKPGELTEVLEMKSFGNDKMFRILKLVSKSRPHKANLNEDYDKISYFAKESKRSQYFNEWLQKKIENTFVEVSPVFSNCPNLERWVKIDVVKP